MVSSRNRLHTNFIFVYRVGNCGGGSGDGGGGGVVVVVMVVKWWRW